MKSKAATSVTCNGQLVAELRAKFGWTQEDFAAVSGYSDRLVRKVESGQAVSRSTVERLASVFVDQGQDIVPADLMVNPASVARQFIEGMYTHKANVIDVLQELIDDQVVLHFAGDPKIFPFAGEHVGLAGARNAFRLFYSVIQPPDDLSELDDFEFLTTGLGALVWGKTYASPIGMPANEPVSLTIRMDFRRGKLIRFDDRFDTAAAQEAFRRAGVDRNKASP